MHMHFSHLRTALAAGLWLCILLGIGQAQEACLKGCAYPPYPGLAFTLGDGFVAKGGEEIKVTHMGFLGSVYNNDGITPRKVGVPNYIGELSVIDPVTGEEKALFRNQLDWVTHANDSGKVISLGVYPKGAPVVFKYVNVDGKEKSYKTFPRYSGDNVAGTYDFNADPVLKGLAINGKPKPVSGGSWNWEGHDYNLWCVAANVPGTNEKQFQFEDADDRIFNDIVFRVSGVALVSETFQLEIPVIAGVKNADETYKVTLSPGAGAVNKGAILFYTLDGSGPGFDSTGAAKGSTRIYTGPLDVTQTTTIKVKAFKATLVNGSGGLTRYVNSPMAESTFTLIRKKLSTPTATPPGAVWSAPMTVSLAQAEGAPIHYRLCDVGAACPDPDAASPVYAGPLTLASPKLLKAIAIRVPDINSEVATFSFTPGKWKTPTASPAGGEFSATVSVTLAQSEGAKIYYALCAPGATCPSPTTASAVYATPLALTGPTVVKAIVIQSPLENSEAATFTFIPAYGVAQAYYLDGDGDGRIEEVRIVLNGNPSALPSGLTLEDPFQQAGKRAVTSADMAWGNTAHTEILATFAPFAPGTGFVPGLFGAFPSVGEGYPSGSFTIKDGAGPVAVAAEAKLSLDSGVAQKLRVRFSEPLAAIAVADGTPLPFRVSRAGEDISAKLKVSGVVKIGDAEYEFTFASEVFPVPGDSLGTTPSAIDGVGNASRMPGNIAVTGEKPSLKLKLTAVGGGCIKGGAIADPRRIAIPLSVIAPRAVDAGTGCPDAGRPALCLDCQTREWKRSDASRYEADALPPGPEIRVTTQAPFKFDLAFFSSLGEFVNRARGEVTAAMLAGIPSDARGYRTVGLQWYPVSAEGNQAATGAYIARGTLSLSPSAILETFPGLPVKVVAPSEKVLLRFGYLRD